MKLVTSWLKGGKSRKRKILVAISAALALVATVAVVAVIKWKSASDRGGQEPAEPFRIAGNLGFDIANVKVLLNSHAHFDHAGGLAALQKASGAELWISEGAADIVAAGGAGDPSLGPLRFVSYFPLLSYPAPRLDHWFKDGATIRVGPVELTARVTAGHTRGCTSWSFPVRDGDRELRVVHRCSLTLPAALSLGEYPKIRADFERSFRTLRSLPVDLWLTAHAREFGRWRKLQERANAKDLVESFIDRKGYLASIDSAKEEFRKLLAEQQQAPWPCFCRAEAGGSSGSLPDKRGAATCARTEE